MGIQVEIRKLHALIKKLLFQGNSFINASQSESSLVYHLINN